MIRRKLATVFALTLTALAAAPGCTVEEDGGEFDEGGAGAEGVQDESAAAMSRRAVEIIVRGVRDSNCGPSYKWAKLWAYNETAPSEENRGYTGFSSSGSAVCETHIWPRLKAGDKFTVQIQTGDGRKCTSSEFSSSGEKQTVTVRCRPSR
jgi:hypothetical protein